MSSVKVIVLGEVGRSPRMMYHSSSLLKAGHKVTIIGYGDSKGLLPSLSADERLQFHCMTPAPVIGGPAILNYLLKTIWQAISLLIALFITGGCSHVLSQCPPSVPTIPVCWLYCLLSNTKLVLDWHNYAYSILSLQNGPNSLIVRLTEKLEFFFGGKAYSHFCVTEAMKNDLAERGIKAKVLYDRPPQIFHPINVQEKHNFLLKMGETYEQFRCKDNPEFTAVTASDSDGVFIKKQRPAILFSSTSWTPDEDFGILLHALSNYDEIAKYENTLAKVICVITGKGPQKEYYLDVINKKSFEKVEFVTPWLKSSEYPLMVASADFGVCLHTSSSGLDLPMKVVDMFGCGLPVCAVKFKCLHELVRNEENGYTFETPQELLSLLVKIFRNFPNNQTQNETLGKFKRNLEVFQSQRWDQNWTLRAKPFFE